MNFSKAIRIIRAKKGISQQKFAEMTSIDSSLVSRLESGDRRPSKNNLLSISRALSIPLNLIHLLAAEKEDFKKLPPSEVKQLGDDLLGLLVYK